MKNKIMDNFITAFNMYKLNYLLFSTDEELAGFESESFDEEFLVLLKYFLEENKECNLYPIEAWERLGIILNYIKIMGLDPSLRSLYNEIVYLYLEINDRDSYDIFYHDFHKRFVNPLSKETTIYNKEYQIDCMKNDFKVILYFASEKNYFFNKLQDFIFDEKYLYTIKKIFYEFPIIFLDKKIKSRALAVLKYNEAYSEENLNIVSEFADKNYENYNEENYSFYEQKYNEFMRFNNELLEKIEKIEKFKYANNYRFDCEHFSQKYIVSYLERYIVLGEEIEINFENSIILNTLFDLIDSYVKKELLNSKMKNNIINLLSEFKKHYSGSKKQELNNQINNYIIKINSASSNEDAYLNYYQVSKLSKKDAISMYSEYKNTNDKTEVLEFLRTLEFDFRVLNSFTCSNQEFKEKYEEMFSENNEFILTIKKLSYDMPYIFINPTIYNRVSTVINKTLELYKNEFLGDLSHKKECKKLLKKINKIYEKR